MSTKSKKKKIAKDKKFKEKEKKLVFYLLFRTVLLVLLVIPCVFISYFIKQHQLVVIAKKAVIATAYSSTIDQTDDTPCITANGFDLCANNREEIIANNGLKFGTKVRIPELFGNRVFTVSDRMNARYGSNRIDIWMTTQERARLFGVQKVNIEVVK